MDAIFVYGTLMRGESHHDLLAGASPMRILPARALGCMIRVGPYAAMVDGDDIIRGEYVEFESMDKLLPRLDEVEGDEYGRERIVVEVDGEGVKPAWVYRWRGTLQDGPRIESGDWRKYQGR